jgi:hypothetical protein
MPQTKETEETEQQNQRISGSDYQHRVNVYPNFLPTRKAIHRRRIGNSFNKENGGGETRSSFSFFHGIVSRPFRPSKVKPTTLGRSTVTLDADFQLL